jgi:branched-chain amino acid transport system permease protein
MLTQRAAASGSTNLIFDICHQVTVLNLGRKLADGTPAEIRVHKEVVSAYLGG